jgi:hypothetical protein
MFNTPHTMSINDSTNFGTIVHDNWNPTIGSSNGQRTIIMCYDDAKGSCVNPQTKKVDVVMCVRIPF